MSSSERNPPEAIHVSIQWRGSVDAGASRQVRRAVLTGNLQQALSQQPGLTVDWQSVSLSAQTVEASVQVTRIDDTVADLESRGLRVDRIVDQQIVF